MTTCWRTGAKSVLALVCTVGALCGAAQAQDAGSAPTLRDLAKQEAKLQAQKAEAAKHPRKMTNEEEARANKMKIVPAVIEGGLRGVGHPNDECGAALAISGEGAFAYDNTTATTGVDGQANPLCNVFGTDDIASDIWFVWTSTFDGNARISTCVEGVNNDTRLAVYDNGGECPPGIADACDDDTCGLGTSAEVEFAVVTGQVLLIQAGQFPGAPGRDGTLTIARIGGGGGDGEACEDAIAVGEGMFDGDTSDNTQDGFGACALAGLGDSPDEWYAYTPTADGVAIISTCGSGFDTVISVSDVCGGTDLACNDDSCGLQSSMNVNVTEGVTVFIRVGGWNGASGAYTLTIAFLEVVECAGSATTCATPNQANAFNSSNGFFVAAESFRPTSDGTLTDLCWYGAYGNFGEQGPEVDSFTINVYSDNMGAPGTLLSSTPAATLSARGLTGITLFGRPEYIYSATIPGVAVSADQCYWIEIVNTTTAGAWFWEQATGFDGFFQQRPGAGAYGPCTPVSAGDLALCINVTNSSNTCISVPPAPGNDLCANATVLPGTGTFNFDLTGANSDGFAGAPCNGVNANNDVFYSMTVPAGCQTIRVETCGGTTIDTVVEIFDICDGATLACNDDFCGLQSRAEASVIPGQGITIRLGSFAAEACGGGTFTVSCVVAPPGDSCGAPIPIAGEGTFNFNTIDATNSGPDDEPSCAAFGTSAINNDVWYDWTASCTLQVTVSTVGGTTLDTRIAVYDGTVCPVSGGTSKLACNDDAGGTLQSTATFQAVQGNHYLIRLGAFGIAGEAAGTFVINCLNPTGACCLANGCRVMEEADCVADGGTFAGEGVACPGYGFTTGTNAMEDISGTGEFRTACDDCGDVVSIGFDFEFFGAMFNQVAVSSNGYLVFNGGPAGDFGNDAVIPNAFTPNEAIYPFWDDYNLVDGGQLQTQTLGDAPNRRFIAQWTNVPQFGGVGDSNTFQCILFENGTFEFRYGNITAPVAGDVTIGAENATGTTAVQVDSALAAAGTSFFFSVAEDPCAGEEFGACCVFGRGSGECSVRTQENCELIGGTYQGDGTDCGQPYNESSGTAAIEDISATGTLRATGDDGTIAVAMGFDFTYFGATVNTAHVNGNGWVSFTAIGGGFFGNGPIPSAAVPNNAVYPLWDDWNEATAGEVFTETRGSAGSRRFVAQWNNVVPFGAGAAAPGNTFQVILHEADGSIEFRYGTIDVEPFAGDYTVGIENADGSFAMSTPGNMVLSNTSHSYTVSAGPCSAPTDGACCLDRCTCEIMTEADCAENFGFYQGDGSECGDVTFGTCFPNTACPCDWNGFDGLDSQDYFDFLNSFFESNADFNCFDGTDSQDFFDFLNCFFDPPEGCGT